MFSREVVELPQSSEISFPEQIDEAAVHNRPVFIIVQSFDPHLQSPLLAIRPSFSLHNGTVLQVLIDASQ